MPNTDRISTIQADGTRVLESAQKKIQLGKDRTWLNALTAKQCRALLARLAKEHPEVVEEMRMWTG